ncbi:MAG: hypothetical protein ACN4GR_01545 [Arenicellales bacterium]
MIIFRFDEIETVSKYRITISFFRAPLVFIMLTAMPGFSILPASGQNPWLESDKPLIDDRGLDLSKENSWREKADSQPEDAIDESKYPPMDENETLGTDRFGYPAVDQALQDSKPVTGSSDFQYPDAQPYRKKPIYPGNRQQSMPGYYENRQYPQYRPGYQSGYPGDQRGFWPGNGGMRGFPFGGGSGSGFPFGGGNDWMPFSNSGYR